jgi:hypothetical protein
MVGFIVLAWIIAPAAYYSNLWGSKAMPIVSNRVFTADGYFYNVSSILDSQLRLNETAYKNYGMLIYEGIIISSNLIIIRRRSSYDSCFGFFICYIICSNFSSYCSYYFISW